MNLEIRPIENLSDEDWDDLVVRSPDWMIHHTSAWLRFVCELCRGQALRLGVYSDDRLIGCWAAVAFSKGPFRLVGSPMRGWHTARMGPFGNGLNTVSAIDLLSAWRVYLETHKVHHAELSSPLFDAVTGPVEGFEVARQSTYVCPVPSTEAEILAQFHSSCRAAARRALRRGVVVESTDNPAFVDHFYYQLEDVFGKQARKPNHPKAHIQALWRNLKPTGRLLTIWAKHDGKIIGAGIYAVGNRCLHAIASSSLRSAQHHYPNEPIRLVAMKVAAERGCTMHDLAGMGDYKSKFGAHVESYSKLLYYRGRWVRPIRNLYAKVTAIRRRRGGAMQPMEPRQPLPEE